MSINLLSSEEVKEKESHEVNKNLLAISLMIVSVLLITLHFLLSPFLTGIPIPFFIIAGVILIAIGIIYFIFFRYLTTWYVTNFRLLVEMKRKYGTYQELHDFSYHFFESIKTRKLSKKVSKQFNKKEEYSLIEINLMGEILSYTLQTKTIQAIISESRTYLKDRTI